MNAYGLNLENLLWIALGGLGLYLLLPRGKHGDFGPVRIFGALLATASLVQTAGNLALRFSHLTNGLAFYVLATISVVSAVLMITSRNPVYSALWFALTLLTNSGLYLLNRAEFLAAATIIIYAGAIIVTFLFVIMLAQPRGTAQYDHYSREPFMSCLAGIILAWTLTGTISYVGQVELSPPATHITRLTKSEKILTLMPSHGTVGATLQKYGDSVQILDTRGHVDGLGRALFLNHYISVEVIGVILLIAVVGALLIATQGTPAQKDSTAPHTN